MITEMPAPVADLLSESGVHPLDWVDDWVALMAMVAETLLKEYDLNQLTPVSPGAIIMDSWFGTRRGGRLDDKGMDENECKLEIK
jgi:hypothetical protein